MIFFRSDYSQGAHPKVMEALMKTNFEHTDGYGLDAHCERAGVDVLMPGDMGHVARSYRSDGSLLHSLGRRGGITRAELQQTALRVLKAVMRLKG